MCSAVKSTLIFINTKQIMGKANSKKASDNKALHIGIVVGSVLRPKNGHELLQHLKDRKKCEVVDWMAFDAAKVLEDHCDFSFSFKKSLWTSGWAGFERV